MRATPKLSVCLTAALPLNPRTFPFARSHRVSAEPQFDSLDCGNVDHKATSEGLIPKPRGSQGEVAEAVKPPQSPVATPPTLRPGWYVVPGTSAPTVGDEAGYTVAAGFRL